MTVALSLDSMTTSDKLSAIEQLWDDLAAHPESVPSPEWHGEVLAARSASLDAGSSGFSDLNEVKERLRKTLG